MFGDIPILGNFSCGIDEKKRIILPSCTKAEKDDKVVFCISDIGTDAIDLYPLSEINNIIKRCDDIIFSSDNDNVVQRARNQKKYICSSAIYQASIDGQRRLTLNPIIFNILGENAVKLYGLGESDRIKFFASEEKFSEYTGHSYIKRV